jgi:hypothetical protein
MMRLTVLFAALLAASSPAAAGSLTLGVPDVGRQVLSSLPPTDAMCEPFGCPQAILTNSGGEVSPLSWTPEFQEVYSSLALPPGSTTFTGIAFYCEGGNPNGGTFTISLSTTSAPTSPNDTYPFDTGLNTSNLSTNVGSDNTVVYSGALPALSNGMLTITFTTPFTYNTADGNLLLDVQSANATNSPPFIYCWNSISVRLPTPWTLESSMAWTNSNLGQPSYIMGTALITTFYY